MRTRRLQLHLVLQRCITTAQSHSGMGGQVNTNSTAGATVLSNDLNDDLYDQSTTWSNWSAETGSLYTDSRRVSAFNNDFTNIGPGTYLVTSTLSNGTDPLVGPIKLRLWLPAKQHSHQASAPDGILNSLMEAALLP